MINESPMRAELVEWNDPGKKAIHPRIQDPGATKMILSVRNLDAILARARRAGAPILTTGGNPMTIEGPDGPRRVVLLQDPDGFFVELVQPTPPPAASAQASNNIYRVDFGVTVSDLDKMLAVFRDALGFDPKAGEFVQDELVAGIAGLPGAETRRARALVPGSNLELEFTEFRNVNRKVNESAPRDAGTPVLRLRIKDIEATLAKMSEKGVTVASKDGEYVSLSNANGSQRFAILHGPDNLKIQLVQAVPKN
jgi:catechol 2,3-dioxygenase-like lactoylglutathione lyase family enzyme